MPPPNKKAKHLEYEKANAFIRKQKQTVRKKENSDILMNTKGRVQTLEDNKVILLVLSRAL